MNKTIIGTIAGVAGTAILGAAGTLIYKKKSTKETTEPVESTFSDTNK